MAAGVGSDRELQRSDCDGPVNAGPVFFAVSSNCAAEMPAGYSAIEPRHLCMQIDHH